jgi:hypothetical protein
MSLTQCNFRLPLWQKRKLAQFAEDDGKTMEGFLQDAINDIFDSRVDELEAEAKILADFAEKSRTQTKYEQ